MGSYIPGKPSKPKSVVETLTEAEEDHLLDCPDADLRLRAAALLLDLILFSLIHSGIQQSFDTLQAYTLHVLGTSAAEAAGARTVLAVLYLSLVAKVGAVYLYFAWTVHRFRGSPGKLLLGLRVVDASSGRPLRPIVALCRDPLRTVGLLGAAFRLKPGERLWHDRLAGSVVKRLHGGSPP
jgi:uncharacterized RDD family membrane protein YckC